MEVDEEIEADLLRQFNCLNTSDKDVLIKELQGLLGRGSNISEQSARFYLDMADWNLQAAIGAYFDLQSSTGLPHMTFIQDVTIGEGESVPCNTSFIKTWRVENTGNDAWPQGCRLLHTGGERLGAIEASEPLSCLLPHTQLDVSMQMVAPLQQGLFSSKWRMSTMEGHFFGDTIWVIIQVDDGGTLALMQQMVNLKELGTSPPPMAPPPSPAHHASTCATQSPPSINPFSVPRDIAGQHSSPFGSPVCVVGGGSSSSSVFSSPASSHPSISSNLLPAPLGGIIPSSTNSSSNQSIRCQQPPNTEQCYFASSTTTNTITSSTRTTPSTYCTPSSQCFLYSNQASSSPPLIPYFPKLSSTPSPSSESSDCWPPDGDHDVTMS